MAGLAAFFTGLTGIVLFRLVAYLGSRVPAYVNGEWDYYHFHWNLWWVRYALTHGWDPFYTTYVLAPFEHNLTYHSLTASWIPYYALVEPLMGQLAAVNSIIWLSMALTGGSMAWFLRRQGTTWTAAVLGGVALAVSPFMLDHAASGHLNLVSAFWLPLVLLLWDRVAAARTFRRAALLAAGLGIVLWGVWLTDVLIVLWAGLLLGPYALYTIFTTPERAAQLRLIVLGGLALVILLALALGIAPLRQTIAFPLDGLEPADMLTLRYYSVPLRALYLPTWGRVQQLGYERDETFGVVLIVLAWAALLLRPHSGRRWVWLGAAVLPLLLALGPDVRLFGQRVPLPFRIIHELFGGQMRTPIRFMLPATFALITFVALSYDRWLRALRLSARIWIAGGVLLAILFDSGALHPYPATEPPRSYALYEMMRAEDYGDTYDYVVLDVPSGPYTGWQLTGSHPEAMVYGITHQKREVSGLLSRMSVEQHSFYETDPLLGWLTASIPLKSSRAASKLNQYIVSWPLGYIVVHMDWLTPNRLQEALAFFNTQDVLCVVTLEQDAVLYRTASHPKGCTPYLLPQTGPAAYTLHLGEAGADTTLEDAAAIGSGWYPPEDIGGEGARWAGDGLEARLQIALPDGVDAYTLTLRAVAFAEPRTVSAVAGRVVDGELVSEHLGSFTVEPGDWGEYSLTISGDFIHATGGQFTLVLAADGSLSAADAGLSGDTRPLTFAVDWLTFISDVP